MCSDSAHLYLDAGIDQSASVTQRFIGGLERLGKLEVSFLTVSGVLAVNAGKGGRVRPAGTALWQS